MMKRRYLQITGFLLALFFLTSVVAAPSPLPMMKQIAQNMITALKRNKSRLSGNAGLVRKIVNRVLIPHVDIYAMAGRVVGRNYWLKASSAQRERFANLFKNKVISTYASALSSYDRDRILFFPLRKNPGKYARVRSLIVRRNGQKIPVNYNLRYQNSRWKIVDLSVENVSIVNNYKAQYADTLRQGGLKNLIAKMRR
jgi:phospholipid transport system substrate-binding protein